MMRKVRVRATCAVCQRSRGMNLRAYNDIALLCDLHGQVVRGIIPAPTTVHEIRALFPAHVTSPRRARSSTAP